MLQFLFSDEDLPVLSADNGLSGARPKPRNAIVGHQKASECNNLCLTPGCVASGM